MWREYLRIARRALLAHRFRSALTVVSITVGAFAIVVMSSLATSGLTTLSRSLEEMGGSRIVFIAPKEVEGVGRERYSKGFTPQDREVLVARVPHLAAMTLFAHRGKKEEVANERGARIEATLLGGDDSFLKAFSLRLRKGRGLQPEDSRSHAKVCVVASGVAQKLFEGDAVGRWLAQGSYRCQIVGEVAPVDRWGVRFGFDWDAFVVTPLETYADSDPATARAPLAYFVTTHLRHNDLVKRVVNALLMERHRGIADFQIWDFARMLDQFNGIVVIMQIIVGFIAGIALLVGGIGVMNMMLVSVSERVREIGIRKALGASPAAIQAQFLWEACILAGTGGLVGVASGAGLAAVVNAVISHFKPTWVGEISVPAVAIALTVSLSLGVGFGFFPARRAGRLHAIEAIRA